MRGGRTLEGVTEEEDSGKIEEVWKSKLCKRDMVVFGTGIGMLNRIFKRKFAGDVLWGLKGLA